MRPAIAMMTRLGAHDGLHVETSFTIALARSAFRLGNLSATLQVPMTRGTWVVARGGFGAEHDGHAFTHVGVRWLARGDGGSGSLFLTGAFGYVRARRPGNDDAWADDRRSGVGPSVGLEYRR